MTEDAGLRIRVDGALRRDFIEACRVQDTTGAQVLRAFMRAYVERQGALRQAALFTHSEDASRIGGSGRDE